ncbi:sugar transferase [Lachnoclostridium sp. An298]|nr:sugar transferase [Lachnoclostridium sp. An298]
MSNVKRFITPHYGIYAKIVKRILDFVLSFLAIVILSPFIIIFSLIGAVLMRGNPFFIQERPGKNEKIFKLIKFRTMTNRKDRNGNLLPDEQRLTGYGKFLRSTSIDEIPELFNILKGDMSIIGPRPLLVKYLPLYNTYQKHRHDVIPGLTGYAQVHGRNTLSWKQKFEMDIKYVEHITFIGDLKILAETVKKVIKRDGISSETSVTMEEFTGNID